MAGGIIIGDVLAPFPSLKGIPERVMLLKDLKTKAGMPVEDPDPSGPTMRMINGFKPRLEMRPGRLEFWRIGNQSSNIFYKLSLNGQRFHIIATDGNFRTGPWRRKRSSCRLVRGSRCSCTGRRTARTSFRTRRSTLARRATNTPASCS